MTQHAVLSASSSHRWLACPPSARYEQEFPSETSPYAEEGTRAHALAEGCLRHVLYEMDPPPNEDEIPDEMRDAVQEYVNTVISGVLRRADTYVEQRVNMTPWVPEGFGTSDAIAVAGNELRVYDLKYGKGVPVSAEENPQARLYALGALHTIGWLYEIDRVRTTIVQPRLDSISTEELSLKDLLAWGETVKPIAVQAWNGDGDFTAGEHCRFCKARQVCRARAEQNLGLAKWEFRRPPDVTTDEIAQILRDGQELEHWLGGLRDHALATALQGTVYPGWKIVEGRANRRYIDESEVLELLLNREDVDALAPRQPIGIPAMEKALGKEVFAQLVKPHVVKPAGKPTLVPESDKREPINLAALDFKEEAK